MRRWTAILIIGGLAMVGCESDSDADPDRGVEDMPPRFVEIPMPSADEIDESEDEVGPPEVEFSLWPGGSDLATSELMWLGSEDALELRQAPHDEAPVIGEGRWEDGAFLDWSTSLVRVDRPRPYQVDEAIEIWGTPYDREFGELEAQDRRYELAAGTQVWLYQYAGDGMCYLLVGEEVILSDCPGAAMSAEAESDLDGEMGFRPLSEQWWVEVVSDEATGWFLVRDAPVEVHSRQSGAFEELEGDYEFEGIPGELPDY